MGKSDNELRRKIRTNYSQVAQNENSGCCSSSNCCSGSDNDLDAVEIGQKLGYSSEDLTADFMSANQGLGCGNPQAIAELEVDEVVLDLGCGAGFDVFLAAEEVGSSGQVIGVDMTPEMIEKARENAEENNFKNVSFRLGEIEHLPVGDDLIDVVISNCVINLSVNKQAVFEEIYRVLKPGGRIAISDVLKQKEFPKEVKDNLNNYSGCITGALSTEELRQILLEAGFKEIEIDRKDNSEQIVKDWSPEIEVENLIFSAYIKACKPE